MPIKTPSASTSLLDTQVIILEASHDTFRARTGLHEEHLRSCIATTAMCMEGARALCSSLSIYCT